MVFTKSFPKNNGAKIWKEVSLTEDEELAAEEYAFDENARAMAECIICAKNIVENMGLKDYQSDIVALAIALFEKTAKHQIAYKEEL